jgi:glutaminyl-peptide cyclotransferase
MVRASHAADGPTGAEGKRMMNAFISGKHRLTRLPALVLGTFSLVLVACAQKSGENGAQTPAPNVASTIAAVEPAALPDSAPAPSFNSTRAMQYVKEIVAVGPRPIGSANHKKVEDYLLTHLKGESVESDIFTADTIEGKFPVRNIVAKFPGTKDGIIVIASHYDTNYPLRDTSFIGANDGASSSALLLEIANQMRSHENGRPRDGYSVWLLWDDAEEAMKHWSDTDSLYGVRHLAQKWQDDGTLKKIKAFLLADMVGDADLNIEHDTYSTPWLEDMIYESATRLGYQSHFFGRTIPVEDDHVPFVRRGVPSADLIDLDYGYNNVFHHTTQDTIDKLSPKSLEIVGSVILETVRMVDQKK